MSNLNRVAQADAALHRGVAQQPSTTEAAEESLRRGRVPLRKTIGRAVVLWIVVYLCLRPWAAVATTAVQATLISAFWLILLQWAAQPFRAMTFAVGAYAVAAYASVAGVVALSALGLWVSHAGIDRTALALLGVSTFVAVGTWDYVVHRTGPARRRVLVVGGGTPTAGLLVDLAREPAAGLEIVSVIDDEVDHDLAKLVAYDGPLEGLAAAVRRVSL